MISTIIVVLFIICFSGCVVAAVFAAAEYCTRTGREQTRKQQADYSDLHDEYKKLHDRYVSEGNKHQALQKNYGLVMNELLRLKHPEFYDPTTNIDIGDLAPSEAKLISVDIAPSHMNTEQCSSFATPSSAITITDNKTRKGCSTHPASRKRRARRKQ